MAVERQVSRTASVMMGVGVAALLGDGVASAQQPGSATAELRDASDAVVGTATFTQAAGGVQITGSARGLTPGQHGWHVHAVGRCDPRLHQRGRALQPHRQAARPLQPAGPARGRPGQPHGRADGSARLSALAAGATLAAGPASLFDADGSSLVIHTGPDDEVTDPAGNSGGRVACGVVVAGAQAAPSALPRTGDAGAFGPMVAAAAAGLMGAGYTLRRWRRRA